jgi:drug/metabolite transporter (DMT)-like permease
MSFSALILVLIASVTHAYWNYLSKQANGKTPFIWLIYILSAIIYLPFVAWYSSKNSITVSWLIVGVGVVSAILRISYFLLLQTGYRKADLSVVYPLARGSGPFFATIGAIIFFKEAPTIYSAGGLLLIIAGVLIITRFKITGGLSTQVKAGIFYGIATGLFIGCYTVWDKLAVSGYHIQPLVLIFISNIFGAIVLAPAALNKAPEIRKELRLHSLHIIAIAILSPFSYILVLMAMQTTPVMYVAPARELSILFGVFMGGRMMNEEDAKRRMFASVFILAGITCLAIG